MTKKGVTGPFRIMVFRGRMFVALERRAFKTRRAARDWIDRLTEYGFDTRYKGMKFRIIQQAR